MLSKHLGIFEERVSTEIALEIKIYYEHKCSQIAMLIHVFEGMREWNFAECAMSIWIQLTKACQKGKGMAVRVAIKKTAAAHFELNPILIEIKNQNSISRRWKKIAANGFQHSTARPKESLR